MYRSCRGSSGDSARRSRAGILYLGALREVLVISVAAGIVLVTLSNAKTVFRLESLSQSDLTEKSNAHPVLSLGVDRDRNALIVHSWPGEFDEIKLDAGTSSRRPAPQFVVSAAASDRNSTSIFLSQWANENQVRHPVFIIRDGELLVAEKLEFDPATMADVRISADGSVAMMIGHEGHAVGWDLTGSEPVRWEFRLCIEAPTNALSPDGRSILVSNFEGDVMICDAGTGVRKVELPKFVQSNRSAAWSSDCQRVAMGAHTGDVSVFVAATGHRIWNIRLDFLFPRCLALSEKGNLLAVGGFDKQIRVWDLSRPSEPPIVLTGDSSVVQSLVFARLDSALISGGSDGTIREWSLASRTMIRQLR